jgi:heme exporter protein C
MAGPSSAAHSTTGRSPSSGPSWSDRLFVALLALATITTIGAIHFIAYRVPTEATMGVVYKIFYFHAPTAYAMYIGATACFVGSAGYLYNGRRGWDAFARAGAEVAVAMGITVLISGPLWGAKACGTYWTWDPRLTTSLLSVMMYVAYVVLRVFAGEGDSERKFSAALGILAAANLPIVHFSVQKWGGNHPKVITKGGGGLSHPDMVRALLLSLLAFTLISVVLLWWRTRIDLTASRLADAEQEALELGIGED